MLQSDFYDNYWWTLTPTEYFALKARFSILSSSCFIFPCKCMTRIWSLIKITTPTQYVWVFSLPAC